MTMMTVLTNLHTIIHRIPGCEDVTKINIEGLVNNEGRNEFRNEEIISTIHEEFRCKNRWFV